MEKKWYELDGKTVGNLLIVLAGVGFYMLLTHLSRVAGWIGKLLEVFSPFIIGFIIAYLLHDPTDYFERKLFHRVERSGLRRGLSIATTYLAALAVIYVLLQLIVPQVGESVTALVNNLPDYMKNLDELVNRLIARFHLDDGAQDEGISGLVDSYDQLLKRISTFVTSSMPDLLDMGRTLGGNIVSGVITAVTAVIASIYMLGGKSSLTVQFRKLFYALLPKRAADRLFVVLGQSNRVFSGFVNGKLLDSAIMGALCFVASTLLRIPYAVLIGVVVGVTNIIPFFGPIIGAVPCLMILLMVDPFAAFRFGLLIVALQQLDGNIIGPKILGDSIGLSSFWVLVAIVVGGGLFGFPGMVLGVPAFAVIYSLLRDWVEKRLKEKRIEPDSVSGERPSL